jgi:hypothetical protein
MFKPLQHIESIDLDEAEKNVISAFYSDKEISVLEKSNLGHDWRVEVYGHEGVRFPMDCFPLAPRQATIPCFDRTF